MSRNGYSYRPKAMDEFGEDCNLCGSTENIVVHHINGDETDDSLENLSVLCHSCHRKIHTHTSHGPAYDVLTEQLPREELPRLREADTWEERDKTVNVPYEVFRQAFAEAEERGVSMGEVVDSWRQEAGHDV